MLQEIESKYSIYFQDAAIYNGARDVLSNINLTINKGSFTYLIGKTGSGKSSLLKAFYGANRISKGVGIVAGYDLSQLNFNTIPRLRRRLGIVFQDFNLLEDLTVEQNLAFILKAIGWKRMEAIQERVNHTLSSVHLEGLNQKMPHQISGGEQQRLVIARALVNQPELILADEPTGNLDPETASEIVQLLESLNREYGNTIIMATHDYRLLEQFPHDIIECLDGEVITRSSIPM